MSPSKPSFFSVVGWSLLAALLVLEGWWLQRARGLSRRALAELTEQRQAGHRLAQVSPAQTMDSERSIDRALMETKASLVALRAAWAGGGDPGTPLPETWQSIDAYFSLAAFVEKNRALAAGAKVRLAPGECFGFGSHLHQGPVAELAQTIARQHAVLDFLVETLIAAQPRALLAVQRELPRPGAWQKGRVPASEARLPGTAARGPGDHPGDFFDWPDSLSLRVPGEIASDAFRLEFVGQAPALRRFLERLAADNSRIIVRRVEVTPVAEGDSVATPARPVAAVAPGLAIKGSLSRFLVVVESVEFVAPVKDARHE